MVLAYVTFGAVLSEPFEFTRWMGLLVAYFLGLGCAAHFLDEARGHPWGTGFRQRTLFVLAAVTLVPAITLGGYYAWTLHTGFLAFVVVETFFALAYNLEWFDGRFHSDTWFAISWAALPFLASLYLQEGRLPIWSIPFAAALASTAIVQISLSRWVKGYRRGPALVALTHTQGSRPISTQELIDRPQRGLQFIVWSVDLLAVGLVLRRLLPALLLLGVLVTPNAAGAQVKPTVTIKKVGQEYRVQGSVRIPAAEGSVGGPDRLRPPVLLRRASHEQSNPRTQRRWLAARRTGVPRQNAPHHSGVTRRPIDERIPTNAYRQLPH